MILLITLAVTGCGTAAVHTLSPEYETVFIRMAKNSTLEYGVEERFTESLVREFQRDGRLRQVSDWRSADLVLEANITRYDLSPVTLNDDNRTAGQNLSFAVKVTVRNPQTGDYVLTESEFSDQGVFFLSNVPNGRREDDIFRRVAGKIIVKLLEGWG